MPPATTTSCGRPESSFCQFLALGNRGESTSGRNGSLLDRRQARRWWRRHRHRPPLEDESGRRSSRLSGAWSAAARPPAPRPASRAAGSPAAGRTPAMVGPLRRLGRHPRRRRRGGRKPGQTRFAQLAVSSRVAPVVSQGCQGLHAVRVARAGRERNGPLFTEQSHIRVVRVRLLPRRHVGRRPCPPLL